ncbi:MAG: glycoside hydrolase family 97 N-terminal domain-containing protein, partial [Sphingopyxis sp.]
MSARCCASNCFRLSRNNPRFPSKKKNEMISKTSLLFGLSMLAIASPAAARECAQSPDKRLELCVSVEGGEALYEVKRGNVTVIAPSRLGLRFAGEA